MPTKSVNKSTNEITNYANQKYRPYKLTKNHENKRETQMAVIKSSCE